jgi:hypothetical protein
VYAGWGRLAGDACQAATASLLSIVAPRTVMERSMGQCAVNYDNDCLPAGACPQSFTSCWVTVMRQQLQLLSWGMISRRLCWAAVRC